MVVLSSISSRIREYPFWPYVYRFRKEYGLGLLALLGVDLVNVSLPLLIAYCIDAIPKFNRSGVLLAGGLLFLLMVLQSLGRYAWRILFNSISFSVARKLRLELYDNLQRLPVSYFHSIRTGDLMSRATNDIEAIRTALGTGMLASIDAVLLLILLVPVMLYLSPKLTLLAFLAYPLVPLLTTKIGGRMEKEFDTLQTELSKLSAYTQEHLGAIRLLKSLSIEKQIQDKFNYQSNQYYEKTLSLARLSAVFNPSLTVISRFGVGLIFLVGGIDVLEGAITVGTFIAFQRFISQLAWPMEAIGWSVKLHQEGLAAEKRLQEIFKAPKVQSVRLLNPKAPLKDVPLLNIHKLTYRYHPASPFQLNLSNLRINQGEKIGIVGGVGSGKSTLFHCLLRIHEPQVGSIEWKGRDVLSIPFQKLRQEIASVEQQVFLFSEAIADNIFMGSSVPHSEAYLNQVSQHACIDQEIWAMDGQFQSQLGEKGINLSGGQRQRVAIARALARAPQLLLLDDCFSAVNTEMEKNIFQNLFQEYPGLTICLATHRLSAMPLMDQVWILDQGILLAQGTHDELLEKNSTYREMWDSLNRLPETANEEAEKSEQVV